MRDLIIHPQNIDPSKGTNPSVEELFLYLRDVAHHRKTVTYSDIVYDFNLPYREGSAMGKQLTPTLYEILKLTTALHLPPITALVVRKSGPLEGLPGQGFWNEVSATGVDVSTLELKRDYHEQVRIDIQEHWGFKPLLSDNGIIDLNKALGPMRSYDFYGRLSKKIESNSKVVNTVHVNDQALIAREITFQDITYVGHKWQAELVEVTLPANSQYVGMEQISQLSDPGALITVQQTHYLNYDRVLARVGSFTTDGLALVKANLRPNEILGAGTALHITFGRGYGPREHCNRQAIKIGLDY